MQVIRGLVVASVVGSVIAADGPARGDDAAVVRPADSGRGGDPGAIDLRLTLSMLLFRETGADAPAVVDQGAALPNASPVRRYFGDLRAELATGGLALDARIRQTTSARYQAGASAGGEYELRTLDYRIASAQTQLTIGRQTIDAVGAAKIDGLAVSRRVTGGLSATLFAGAYPALGSRSLDTDYVRVSNPGGPGDGDLVVPVAGGLGVAYRSTTYHGDLGVAAVHVAQDVPDAPASEKSRVFTTASGYWRIAGPLDVYHFAQLDVAGASGAALTNGSLGIDARPIDALQLGASIHHVATDVLAITARNALADPDPSAIGIVQNNLAVTRISQDVARASASVALAAQRFEISASGALHRRPEVRVALADGGAVAFPEARSADASLSILDRRSVAGLRAQLSATLIVPVGGGAANRTRGTLVRLAVGRGFAGARGEIEVDAMAERFRDVGAGTGMCMTSRDAFECYGTSLTVAAQAGALASWRVGREWLVLADVHAGYRDVDSSSVSGSVAWPRVVSITSFIRVQWRYR